MLDSGVIKNILGILKILMVISFSLPTCDVAQPFPFSHFFSCTLFLYIYYAVQPTYHFVLLPLSKVCSSEGRQVKKRKSSIFHIQSNSSGYFSK